MNVFLGDLQDSGKFQAIIDTLEIMDTSELGVSRLINYYLLDNQISKAKNAISKFSPKNNDLQEELVLQSMKANLGDKNYDSLSLDDIKMLNTLADEYSYAGIKARNILTHLRLAEFEELIEIPSNASSQRRAYSGQMQSTYIQDNTFAVYPNPANDNVIVTYDMPGIGAAELKVFDMLGKVVFNLQLLYNTSSVQINTSEWVPGMYIVQLIAPNQDTRTTKLLLMHE
jgi:hypothetical protein